jgi:hypothetical protein
MYHPHRVEPDGAWRGVAPDAFRAMSNRYIETDAEEIFPVLLLSASEERETDADT